MIDEIGGSSSQEKEKNIRDTSGQLDICKAQSFVGCHVILDTAAVQRCTRCFTQGGRNISGCVVCESLCL